jgi:hypothetical protein
MQNAANLGIPSPAPQQIGREVFSPGRVDPKLGDIYQLEDSASSTYHGVSVSVNRKLSELEFSANYTLSKTLDDASDFDEQPQNPFDTRSDRALSRNDDRQRFVLSMLWELPKADESSVWPEKVFGGIELAPIFTVGSGRPANPLTGLDSNRSHVWPLSARPLGFGRNSLSTGSSVNLDLGVNKSFPVRPGSHLSLVVAFFNLFDRRNVTQINPFFGSNAAPLPGFGQPIGSLNPRQIQFSLEYEF